MAEALGLREQAGDEPRVRSLTACVLCSAAVLVSFSICTFNPNVSLYSTDMFDHRDNASAERQSGVTGKSVIGYALLGLSGVVAFAVAPRGGRVDWLVLAAIAGFLLLCFGSVAWSIERGLTVRKLGVATFGLVAALGYARLLGLRGLAMMCAITAAVGVLLGLGAELRLGTFRPWARGYAFVGMLDKNGQALWISFFVLPVLILWSRGKRRTLALSALGVAMVLLVLTNSRTALASCLVAAMTGLFLKSSGWVKTLLASAAALAGGGLMLLIGLVGGEGVAKIAALGRTEHIGKLTGRVPLWRYVLGDLPDRPLLGHGYHSYWTAKKIDEVSSTFFWQAHQAHSVYVDLLLALGLLGLMAFLVMLLAGMLSALAKYNRADDPAYLFAMSVIVMAVVNGFAESKFLGFGLSGIMLFACLFGVAFDTGAAPARAGRPLAPPGGVGGLAPAGTRPAWGGGA